jgi:hypothetical protein
MTARRHHFISQCYLRGFTEDPKSPKLFVTDFKERRTFWPSPANVALEQDFHTIDIPGAAPDIIEKKLAEFESDLGPALLHIVETSSLADENDRGVLFFFMALLVIKNPTMRKTIGEWMGPVLRRLTVGNTKEGFGGNCHVHDDVLVVNSLREPR